MEIKVSLSYEDAVSDFVKEVDSIKTAEEYILKDLKEKLKNEHFLKRIDAEYHDNNDIEIHLSYFKK